MTASRNVGDRRVQRMTDTGSPMTGTGPRISGVGGNPVAGEIMAGGITMSVAIVVDLIAIIDHLDGLAKQRGAVSTPRTVAIRESLTCAVTCVGASAQVSAAHDVLAWDRDAVVDTRQAARMLGISTSGVRDLCKRGTLDADNSRGQWFISLDSAEAYRARGRRGTRTRTTDRRT